VLIGKGKLPILGETLNQAFSSKQMSHTRRLGIKSHNQHCRYSSFPYHPGKVGSILSHHFTRRMGYHVQSSNCINFMPEVGWLLLFFKVFFILIYIKIIFFYFEKIIFYINVSK
jgi:hypothetical protein